MNKNVTLAIDAATLAAGRAYAKRHNTTLNNLIRELLERTVKPDQQTAVEQLLRTMDENPGHSGGWKFNREEIYAERLDRYPRR